MEVDLIFRIAAIGIIVSVLYQVLLRSGREEQAMLTSLAGLIVVLTMLIYEISGLFDTVKEVFGLVVLWKLPLCSFCVLSQHCWRFRCGGSGRSLLCCFPWGVGSLCCCICWGK